MKGKTMRRLWIGIGFLIFLAPLGLLLPDAFNAGDAWGEWGPEEIFRRLGYLPHGMLKISGLWKAPLPDYALSGRSAGHAVQSSAEYIVSALLGTCLVVLLCGLLGKWLAGRAKDES